MVAPIHPLGRTLFHLLPGVSALSPAMLPDQMCAVVLLIAEECIISLSIT
jgi:hypothetical protein